MCLIMNNKIFVKSYEKTAVDYYETSLEREENGLIGEYEEMDKGDGIEHLCNTFEGELAYLGYAKTSEELDSLVEKWGEVSGEGSDWAMNEFSGENHYCMVFCEGQDKGGAFKYDYALSLFYDDDSGVVMLEQLLSKYCVNFEFWDAEDLLNWLKDFLNIKIDSADEQDLERYFDLEKSLHDVEACEIYDSIEHMIRFNHIDFNKVDF